MGSSFRKGSSQSGQAEGAAQQQIAIANALFQESTPGRQAALGQLTNFLQTGAIPMSLTGDITTQEQELASAREGILGGGARGGQLQQALVQLPVQRLAMRDQLRSGIFNTALGSLLGQAPVALQGLGSAAGTLSNLGGQRIQQNMAFQQGTGQLAGGLAKLALCWIAMRLYGPASCEVAVLRHWLLSARRHWWFTRFYARYGEWLSQRSWVGLWRPWFDRLVQQARGDLWGL